MKDLVGNIAWGAGIVVLALVGSAARARGLIDAETVTRLVIGATGLMVVWWGNRMPKAFVPDVRARQVARVGGWSMVLSGLVYAGVFAFAPIQTAVIVGCAAIALGIAVTFGYLLSLRHAGDAA